MLKNQLAKKLTPRTMLTSIVRHKWRKVLRIENINPNCAKMEYAVYGQVVQKAIEIEADLRKGTRLPFNRVIYANIGDAQIKGLRPLTYLRQVLSLFFSEHLFDYNHIPDDAKRKAEKLFKEIELEASSVLAIYKGYKIVRQDIASFIERRDGYPCDPDDIYIFSGASNGIVLFLKLLSQKEVTKHVGILLPIPYYPLYSATLVKLEIHHLKYNLKELTQWKIDVDEVKASLTEARKVCKPIAIVVINPNNPTGGMLTEENMQQIVKLAYDEHLIIIADEVYQENVYFPPLFTSFKKIACQLGTPYNRIELFSLNSISKGFACECGLRGAYAEAWNFHPEVKDKFEKMLSVLSNPSTAGQIALDVILDPPKFSDESYKLYAAQKQDILNAFLTTGTAMYEAFSNSPGFKCNQFQASLYLYPSFYIPNKAMNAARKLNMLPDVFYVYKLLEHTGICVIPGSGFGQPDDPGKHYFRTTVLMDSRIVPSMLKKWTDFHTEFLQQYN